MLPPLAVVINVWLAWQWEDRETVRLRAGLRALRSRAILTATLVVAVSMPGVIRDAARAICCGYGWAMAVVLSPVGWVLGGEHGAASARAWRSSWRRWRYLSSTGERHPAAGHERTRADRQVANRPEEQVYHY